MMNAAELSKMIGTTQLVRFPLSANSELYVACRVVDARQVYNRVDLLVVPLEGHGTGWVCSSRCKAVEKIESFPSTTDECFMAARGG